MVTHGWRCTFKKSKDPSIIEIQKQIFVLCKKYDASADQVLLAWLKKHPSGIVPVLGPKNYQESKVQMKV